MREHSCALHLAIENTWRLRQESHMTQTRQRALESSLNMLPMDLQRRIMAWLVQDVGKPLCENIPSCSK